MLPKVLELLAKVLELLVERLVLQLYYFPRFQYVK